jgi:divalent metal cation (Fe/Co/Zn/Cd) transporter
MKCLVDGLLQANHSLFDLVADLVTFLAVRESAKAPSFAYPHGRAKVR